MKLLTKICNRPSSLHQIAHIPMSHSISKVLAKFGKASKGVVLNLSLSKLKAFSCSSFHLKPTFFLMHSVNGAAKVEKSLMNLL